IAKYVIIFHYKVDDLDSIFSSPNRDAALLSFFLGSSRPTKPIWIHLLVQILFLAHPRHRSALFQRILFFCSTLRRIYLPINASGNVCLLEVISLPLVYLLWRIL
ncbi:MAG: hypothetical protein WAK17_24590, partial [Candidatus Nitrosopolaris sp.]